MTPVTIHPVGDRSVSLFGAAGEWAGGARAARLVGPGSFTPWEELGLLVEAHERPVPYPAPWNPGWAEKLVEDAGARPTASLTSLSLPPPEQGEWRPAPAPVRLREVERSVAHAAGDLSVSTEGLGLCVLSAAGSGVVAAAGLKGHEEIEITVADTASELSGRLAALGARPVRRYRLYEQALS